MKDKEPQDKGRRDFLFRAHPRLSPLGMYLCSFSPKLQGSTQDLQPWEQWAVAAQPGLTA